MLRYNDKLRGEDIVVQPKFWTRNYQLRGQVPLQLGQRTLVMGILNITPDSFSDGGKYNSVERALEHVDQLIIDGVDIIDIGGESTRPGFVPVSIEEEIKRVVPVIEAVRQKYPSIPLSIDTYKAATAQAALEAGAHIVNDIWCLKYDPQMAHVVAEYGCPVILNHNRTDANVEYGIADVITDLLESVEIAMSAGVARDQIWLDPGIGFAKTYEQNLDIHARLDQLNALGYPVLLGTSRKKFIREALNRAVDEIDEGTIASNVLGITQGCQIVRVHDVPAMKKAALMADALLYRLPQYKE